MRNFILNTTFFAAIILFIWAYLVIAEYLCKAPFLLLVSIVVLIASGAYLYLYIRANN